MLEHITPVILTYNEAPNIGRVLEKLSWAKDIVVVDSFSSDNTLEIIRRFRQARVFQRDFDGHAAQWNFALQETGVNTEWVLALDADYIPTDEFIEELRGLNPGAAAGFRARFAYCVFGRRLRGSIYPPVTVLYRRMQASYSQDGHTQRVSVAGSVMDLKGTLMHDDRKPLGRWLRSQQRYMRLEAEKISEAAWRDIGWADRLRKMRLPAPFVMLFYCMFIKGALLDGLPGIYYALQRMTAEAVLSLYLIKKDLEAVKRKTGYGKDVQ